MTQPEIEGVVKFHLDFQRRPLPDIATHITELNAWRHILFRLGLTGRDPARYGGLAYGNVSCRAENGEFIVSGTQTGGKHHLSANDYCRVLNFNLDENRLGAEGSIEPSSEALSHGAIYAALPQASCVLHVHSAEIWQRAERLGLPVTDASIAYGTPEMGRAVSAAAVENTEIGIIVMGGHQDGVLAFAERVDQAALRLLQCLAKALASDF
jgi:hypothetical protein